MTEKRRRPSTECHLGVEINVGGTIFRTSFLTLTRIDNTMLSTMVANHWRNQEELFIDRNPTHFGKVLDYLRDGDNFALPLEEDVREALRKEAEFYNIPGLAKICSDIIKVGDKVQWKDNVIETYWKYLVRHLYAYPTSDTKMCMACACFVPGYLGPTSRTHTNIVLPFNASSSKPTINYEDWALLKYHMRTMKGTVAEVSEQCCRVKYSSALELHIPRSALRLSR